MLSSVHKVSILGSQIILSVSLPIGHLHEEFLKKERPKILNEYPLNPPFIFTCDHLVACLGLCHMSLNRHFWQMLTKYYFIRTAVSPSLMYLHTYPVKEAKLDQSVSRFYITLA